ncbi:MAG TPA: PEP/pyruvate-binding domain-containing protein [Polyangia bacterium]|jgi:hypothetical protein|nr:PEP/pyruvate-binding domain-containing protein [Polyangia bacterium]
MQVRARPIALAASLAAVVGCGGGGSSGAQQCRLAASVLASANDASDGGNDDDGGAAGVPDDLQEIGCYGDFEALASVPIDQSIPGGISAKIVYDSSGAKPALYFQNSKRFLIHYDFASKNLSGPEHPTVPPLAQFNTTEYGGSTESGRRFLLGDVTYYEGPKIFAIEIAPYDTMPAGDIAKFFRAIKASAYFGARLTFHPTSDSVTAVAATLPADVPVKTTDDIFAAIDYEPLNLATTVGQIKFHTAAELASDDSVVGYQDIVVLDSAVGQIPPCAGLITQDFQTPLSHLNVLSENRGTPNMGLRSALTNPTLLQYQNQWVQFTVGPSSWSATPVSDAFAQQWWADNKPTPVTLPVADFSVTAMTDVQDLVIEDPKHPELLGPEIATATRAFGSKGSNYGVLANTGVDAGGNVISLGKDATGATLNDPEKAVYRVPVRPAFVIPLYWYHQFFVENGFYDQVDAMLADESFVNDSAKRTQVLTDFMNQIIAAPLSQAFSDTLRAKLEAAGIAGKTVRFRSSTNAEDLDAFPCAGCYDSKTGDPADWTGSLLVAVKEAWASAWKPRTFDERTQHSIDHKTVAMGLLVHENFANPSEYANGVTLTANPFEPSGLEPAFFLNYQQGGQYDVVEPAAGITSDEIVYYWYNLPDQPTTYLAHSNIVLPTQTVLNAAQLNVLGTALDTIHKRFSYAYGPLAATPNKGFYAVDDESKFLCTADPTEKTFVPTNCNYADPSKNHTVLIIKQARPNSGEGYLSNSGNDN